MNRSDNQNAAFLCSDLGLAAEPRTDHIYYIYHLMKVRRADCRAIFQAAAHARRLAESAGLSPKIGDLRRQRRPAGRGERSDARPR